MLHRFVSHLRGNLVAYLALFVALGGTSYAAVSLPRNSVGTRQLRNGAVSAGKIRNGAISPGKLSGGAFGGRILYSAEIAPNGAVLASDPKGAATSWQTDGGIVTWHRRIPIGCFPLTSATQDSQLGSGVPPYASGALYAPTTRRAGIQVASSGQVSVGVVVVCGR